MLELMGIRITAKKSIVNISNARRSIAGDLLDDSDVHTHVKEWISLTIVDGEVTLEHIGFHHCRLILRMCIDNFGDRPFERLQRHTVTVLAPRVDENPSNLLALLAEEHDQYCRIRPGTYADTRTNPL